MDQLMAFIPILTAIIGVACVIVSTIVQMTKSWGALKNFPTQAWTIIVSVLVCVPSYFAYASYEGIPITWYFVFGTIVLSFIVAYITINGWDSFAALVKRFYKKE